MSPAVQHVKNKATICKMISVARILTHVVTLRQSEYLCVMFVSTNKL